tara:strand:+ start:37 stop:297 length:261 start_codon:yes stop_codon:yes gene_type:complete
MIITDAMLKQMIKEELKAIKENMALRKSEAMKKLRYSILEMHGLSTADVREMLDQIDAEGAGDEIDPEMRAPNAMRGYASGYKKTI